MSAVTKITDISVEELADYLRLAERTADDTALLETLLSSAKAYVCNFTGQTESQLSEYPDIVIAVYILVQDAWDNRTLYVDKGSVNHSVETILNMHATNLLPSAEESSANA